MHFKNYISKLLWEYDCVIIPDFGGFVGNYANASIHPTQHTFEPPYKQIAFNKNLQVNDGLLANAVMQGEGINFAEANNWIEQEVLRLQIRLAKKEMVEIVDVGTFFYDVERNLQFKPSGRINYRLDSYGLSAFQSPAIKRENYADRIEKQFVDRPAIPFPNKKGKLKKLWPIAVAIPLLFLLLWIPLKSGVFGNLKANYSNLNPFASEMPALYTDGIHTFKTEIPTRSTISTLVDSSLNLTYVDLGIGNSYMVPVRLQDIKQEAQSLSNAVKAEVAPLNQSGKYFLIAGCFKEKQNADALVAELITKGFAAELAGQNSIGLYRVSFHSFSDKQAALAAKTELSVEHPGVWVYRN